MLKNGSIIGNVNNPTRASTRGLWDNNDVFLGAKSGIWPVPVVFSGFTFTNGTNTGPTGPTSANLLAAYDTVNNAFLTDTEFFTVSNGIQVLRLTTTGVYRIEAYGAEGGAATVTGKISGKGAIMKGDFSLSANDLIYILVGQQGQAMGYAPGGGGGTFVATGTSVAAATALIVAGGGGAAGDGSATGQNASTSTSGTSGIGNQYGSGGTSGNGGSGSNGGYGESGAGFFTNSTSTRTTYGSTFSTGVNSFRNGGAGSGPWPANSGASCAAGGGGFGGGGAGGCNGGGGGGGYSGGGAGNGGGGSINSGTNQANTTGHVGHGKVIITKL